MDKVVFEWLQKPPFVSTNIQKSEKNTDARNQTSKNPTFQIKLFISYSQKAHIDTASLLYCGALDAYYLAIPRPALDLNAIGVSHALTSASEHCIIRAVAVAVISDYG